MSWAEACSQDRATKARQYYFVACSVLSPKWYSLMYFLTWRMP